MANYLAGVARGDAMHGEQFLGQIKPAAFGILSQIAQNVCQLQGAA